MPVERVRQYLTMCKESPHHIVLVAVKEGVIIARAAALEGFPNIRMQHRGKFSISVSKAYWHQGIGTKMMQRIVEYAKEVRLRSIELEVVADNEVALALYKKMGFVAIGTYKDFWCVNGLFKDGIMMQKLL